MVSGGSIYGSLSINSYFSPVSHSYRALSVVLHYNINVTLEERANRDKS